MQRTDGRKKLTDSQLSPPHGINKKLKCETKNKIVNHCRYVLKVS